MKKALFTSSAIALALSITPIYSANATTIANGTTSTTQVNLTNGETLTLEENASLNVSTTPVIADNVTGVGVIVEEGAQIMFTNNPDTEMAIAVINGSDMSGGIDIKGDVIGGTTNEGAAIYVNNAEISGDITIHSTGALYADDTFSLANGGVISGDINNAGIIYAHDEGGKIERPMCEAFQLADIGTEISGTITNTGTIKADKAVFDVTGGAIISGDIINENTGVIESTGESGPFDGTISIYQDKDREGDPSETNGDISGNIINKGTMNGTTSFTEQLAIVSVIGADMTGGIINSGTMNANNAYLAVYVEDGSIAKGITINDGVLTPYTEAEGLTEIIVFDGVRGVTPININGGSIQGTILDTGYNSGDDFSPVTIGGAFTQEGDFQVSSFTVSTDGDFTLGEDYSISTYSAIENNGIMRVLSGQTATIGEVVGSGTFAVEVKDDGNSTLNTADFGNFQFNLGEGDIMDISDDTIHFEVDGTIALGSDITIIYTGGTGSFDGDFTVTDNSSAYKFIVTNNGDNISVTVEESSGIEVAAGNADNQRAANVLQELIDADAANGDAKLESVLNAAMDAADSAALDEVVNKMRRPVDGSTVAGGLAVARKSANMAMSRLSAVRGGDTDVASADSFSLDNGESGMAAGNPYFFTPSSRNKHAWAQAFGQYAEQSERQGFEGYDSHTYGMMFGVDSKEIIDDATIGVAVS